jgi:hypothetical protein
LGRRDCFLDGKGFRLDGFDRRGNFRHLFYRWFLDHRARGLLDDTDCAFDGCVFLGKVFVANFFCEFL